MDGKFTIGHTTLLNLGSALGRISAESRLHLAWMRMMAIFTRSMMMSHDRS